MLIGEWREHCYDGVSELRRKVEVTIPEFVSVRFITLRFFLLLLLLLLLMCAMRRDDGRQSKKKMMGCDETNKRRDVEMRIYLNITYIALHRVFENWTGLEWTEICCLGGSGGL
jgi:hypothetical protein